MPLPIRDFVRRIEPYVPGEQPREADVVKLNTNENPYPPAPGVMAALANLGPEAVRKYPPATADALRDAIGGRLGFPRERVIVGYGSDEILRLLCHALTGPDRPLVSLSPSYSLYPTLGALYDARTILVEESAPDADGFATLPEGFVTAAAPLAFLANPNPPYGAFYPLSEIERACRGRADRVVVVDEAYVDFAPESAAPLLHAYENLCVTRTFSKSHSLAGLRVGFALGAPELIETLMALKDSYNLPSASQAAALAAWEAMARHDDVCRRIVKTRARLADELRARGLQVAPSHGNFVFARSPRAREIYEGLKARGVLVRYWPQKCPELGLRLTTSPIRATQ